MYFDVGINGAGPDARVNAWRRARVILDVNSLSDVRRGLEDRVQGVADEARETWELLSGHCGQEEAEEWGDVAIGKLVHMFVEPCLQYLRDLSREVRKRVPVAVHEGGQTPRTAGAVVSKQKELRKIAREEAEAVARKLAEANPSSTSWTAAQWAKSIEQKSGKSCSATTVKSTTFWMEVMANTGRGRSKSPSPRATELTSARLATTVDQKQETPQDILMAQEEEAAAIQRVRKSRLPDETKASLICELQEGTKTPIQADRILALAAKQQADGELSPFDASSGKTRIRKQL
jgi:hypothetical protein